MGLQGISDYLERFRNLKTPKEFKKNLIKKYIQKYCGVVIDVANIEIRGKNVFLKIPTLHKNEIALHQEEIVEALKKEKIFISRLT